MLTMHGVALMRIVVAGALDGMLQITGMKIRTNVAKSATSGMPRYLASRLLVARWVIENLFS